MSTVFALLSVLAGLGAFACWLLILIAAFQDELWKGFVSLLCGLYSLYYALFEYEADNKWLIILGWIGLGILAGSLRFMAFSTHTAALSP